MRYSRLWVVVLAVFLAGISRDASGATIQGQVVVLDKNKNPKSYQGGTVVFIDEHDHLSVQPAVGKTAAIRQVNKKFVPAVLPVQVGTAVDFPNDDIVFHNVFSLSKVKNFDLGLYAQGKSKTVVFDRPGQVKIYCNIHPEMTADIIVVNNPYFTVTDENGRFTIRDVPSGKAVVRTWHPQAREHPEQVISILEDEIKDVQFSLIEDVRFQIELDTVFKQHHNKWGEEYPAKY